MEEFSFFFFVCWDKIGFGCLEFFFGEGVGFGDKFFFFVVVRMCLLIFFLVVFL